MHYKFCSFCAIPPCKRICKIILDLLHFITDSFLHVSWNTLLFIIISFVKNVGDLYVLSHECFQLFNMQNLSSFMIPQQYKWLYGDFYGGLQILYGRLICGFDIFLHGFSVTVCQNISIYLIPFAMRMVGNKITIFFEFINIKFAKQNPCFVKCMGKSTSTKPHWT